MVSYNGKRGHRKPKKSDDNDDEAPDGVYGWVLILRGLARAAIMLGDHPAALRVLCVAMEYANQDGLAKISQDTIAARLNMSRQAVNKHLAKLDELKILLAHQPKDGVLKRYVLETGGLEEERWRWERVIKRRAEKRAAKKGKFDPAKVKPKPVAEPNPAGNGAAANSAAAAPAPRPAAAVSTGQSRRQGGPPQVWHWNCR
jgi:hypothetical protein